VSAAPLTVHLPQEAQNLAILRVRRERKIVQGEIAGRDQATLRGSGVIDSPYAVPRYSPRTDCHTGDCPVSRARLINGRGRAGVTDRGCYRPLDQTEDRIAVANNTPEILEADLAPLRMNWRYGACLTRRTPRLDRPPAAAFTRPACCFATGRADDNGTVPRTDGDCRKPISPQARPYDPQCGFPGLRGCVRTCGTS
jgi:ATP-dependent helicase HrpB